MKNVSSAYLYPTLFFLFFLLFPFHTDACTTFCMKDSKGHIIFGRNFDFPSGLGTVEINHRSQVKTSFISPPETPFSWTSRYGSITFNQIGREFPYGGMNEAGLVIEQMWHQDAKYPLADNRKALSELQWIQYQLDNAASVNEVIKSDTEIRISNTSTATLHFLISDASGNLATIEFLDGKTVVHMGKTLPFPVLANCSYETSLNYKSKKEAASPEIFPDQTENSSGRFTKVAEMINAWTPDSGNMVDYGFSILQKVAQGSFTQWSIVYDISEKKIYYRTHANPAIRSLDFKQFNYQCNGPALRVNIDSERNQPSSFLPADYEGSYNLLTDVCIKVDFLKEIPEEVRKAIAGIGLKVICE